MQPTSGSAKRTLVFGVLTFATLGGPRALFALSAAVLHGELRDDFLPALLINGVGVYATFLLGLAFGLATVTQALPALTSAHPTDRWFARLGLGFVGLSVLVLLREQLAWRS